MLYYIRRYIDNDPVMSNQFNSTIYCIDEEYTYPFIERSDEEDYKIYYNNKGFTKL